MRQIVLICLVCAVFGANDLVYKSAYEGAKLSDAFDSVHYVGNGIVLAGKRSCKSGARIFRSTDHGKPGTWKATPEPTGGFSGAHVYFFDHNGKVVITGTGDTGNPCMLRSTDSGATWKVVLSSSKIKTLAGGVDPGAVFSPLYMGNNRWIANLRSAKPGKHIIESTDNGATWHSLSVTGLVGGSRIMRKMSDGSIYSAGLFADSGKKSYLYISRDKGKTWEKKLEGKNVFSGIAEFGNGVFVAGTYGTTSRLKVTRRERHKNIARLRTSTAHKLTNSSRVAIFTMSDASYDVRPSTPITVINDYEFTYKNTGKEENTVAESKGEVAKKINLPIFRSADNGKTWTQTGTLGTYSSMAYIREVVVVSSTTAYAYACASENNWADRNLMVYRTDDAGKSWKYVDFTFRSSYGRLNAIYHVTSVGNNTWIGGSQPDSNILYITKK